MIVVGTDFGQKADGRRLLLQVGDRSQRVARVAVPIEQWTPKAIRARIPEKLPLDPAKAALLLVDEKDRVLGRAPVELAVARGRAQNKKAPDETGRGAGAHAGKADPDEAKKGKDSGRQVALVLEGGGAFGAFQLGVINALYERGLRPSIIVGTSVGALNAAKLAEGYEGVHDDLRELWMSIRGNESIYVENPRVTALKRRASNMEDAIEPLLWEIGLTTLLAPGVGHGVALEEAADVEQVAYEAIDQINATASLNTQMPLAELVLQNLSPERVAQSGIQLRLATMTLSGFLRYFTERGDIETDDGQPLVRGRSSGPALGLDESGTPGTYVRNARMAPSVGDGVMASSAIPIIFQPWMLNAGEAYWDGAVRESLPLRKAFDLGATDVVAIKTGPLHRRKVIETSPQYTLVVLELHAIDRPDDGGADYFARVKIGDYDYKKSHYVEDSDNPTPGWRFDLDRTNLRNMDGRVTLDIWDEDSPDKNDPCDANPADGARQIQIRIDEATGRVTGDVEGEAGDMWTVSGSGDENRVKVVFSVVRMTPVSPLARVIPVDLMPIRRVAQLADQFHAESAVEDLRVLEPVDVLHDLAAAVGEDTVLRAMRSSPSASEAMRRARAIPRYLVVEAPVVVGEITDFDREIIRLNYRIGTIVGSRVRLTLLGDATPTPAEEGRTEQEVRSEVLTLLRTEADRWKDASRQMEGGGWRSAGSDPPPMWKRYEYCARAARHLDGMRAGQPLRSRVRP